MERQKSLIKDYQIIKTIGTGTFGRVYLSKSKIDNTYYAMKSLKKAQILNLKQTEHIYNEYLILKDIKHNFIVNRYSLG